MTEEQQQLLGNWTIKIAIDPIKSGSIVHMNLLILVNDILEAQRAKDAEMVERCQEIASLHSNPRLMFKQFEEAKQKILNQNNND